MAECITDSMDVSLIELRELVMDREAWRAVIHGVTKSQTRLKRLSSSSSSSRLVMTFLPRSKRLLISWLQASSAVILLCYAKSLQSCPTLCDPRDGSPLGSPVPGILQARTLEWVAISFSNARQHIILPTKVHLVKAMVFPVVMYECESWTIKKAEC